MSTVNSASIRIAEIFDGLAEAHLGLIAALAQERTYKLGETILSEGTPGDGLYIIIAGLVDVLVDPSRVSKHYVGKPYVIATLRPGQVFGEMSLVDDGLRSATVQAVQYATRIIFIPRRELLVLCEGSPDLGFRLMRNLAADIAMKLRTTDLRVRDAVYYSMMQPEKGADEPDKKPPAGAAPPA